MDVVTAFLNGTLKEVIYMRQPPGFEQAGLKHFVCRLIRSIYGLKQSPRAWYEEIDSFLISIKCIKSELDPNLYVLSRGSEKVFMLLFVDDMLITGNSPELIRELKEQLRGKYEMKDLGKISRYLGVDFISTTRGIFLNQITYAADLVKEYGLELCKPVYTPLPEGLTLSAETSTPEFDSTIYSKLVGKLIYLTNTRPDICFSVGIVSRFMANPQQLHWDCALHIVRYINTTISQGLFYNRGADMSIQGFTDSDWGSSCPDTRRSTGGYIFIIAGGPISWRSKRQPTVSRSSTEAEYKALSDASQEGVYLKRLLQELQHVGNTATIHHTSNEISENLSPACQPTLQDLELLCDNVSAIKLSKNPVFHARTKHLEVHHHFIRERILQNEISVSYISTADQSADILTKSLGRTKFEYHRSRLGMKSLEDVNSLRANQSTISLQPT